MFHAVVACLNLLATVKESVIVQVPQNYNILEHNIRPLARTIYTDINPENVNSGETRQIIVQYKNQFY